MTIIKFLRKPHFALFLASLILFSSCSKDGLLEDSNLNENTLTLEQYIVKHIELTTQMTNLTNSISNDDFKKLVDLENKSFKTKNYEIALKDKEVNIPEEINRVQLEIFENTKTLYNNPKYNSLNEEEFLSLITNEIEVKFSDKLFLSKSSSYIGNVK